MESPVVVYTAGPVAGSTRSTANRLPTTALEEGDRAGSVEDVYSTLSRRHELRRRQCHLRQ